jgi:hypothetical protein
VKAEQQKTLVSSTWGGRYEGDIAVQLSTALLPFVYRNA